MCLQVQVEVQRVNTETGKQGHPGASKKSSVAPPSGVASAPNDGMSGSRVNSSASSTGGREKRGGGPTRGADVERERGGASEMSDEVTVVTAEDGVVPQAIAPEKDSPDAALVPQDVRRSSEGAILRPEREWFNMVCYGLPNLVVTVVI